MMSALLCDVTFACVRWCRRRRRLDLHQMTSEISTVIEEASKNVSIVFSQCSHHYRLLCFCYRQLGLVVN
ncbi:unnamed protein product [Lactuca virosa]|uniref:Uncharacterized protein n=1 Tax=Lactuca virosa TaxID=75947 RepID=A0AAU9LZY9_9ASTR|nr:unnamed protein product [Lactuca virosa]